MIDIPNNISIPTPSAQKQVSTITTGLTSLQIKGILSSTPSFLGEGEVTHRNSVTARDSNPNLAKKDQKNKLSIKKTTLSGSGHVATLSDPSGTIYPAANSGITNALKEDPKSSSSKSSTSTTPQPVIHHTGLSSTVKDDSNNPLKARFISFGKRIKGTVTGASHSELPKLNKTAESSASASPNSVDLKTKNNSSAKLSSYNKNNVPSASAYDISLHSTTTQLPKSLDDYYVIRRVGKGGFATVFLVRLKNSTGRYYALKVIKKSEVVRLKQEKQIMNEKNILFELKHPLLIDLYNTFQSPCNLFMVLEFVAGGDLFTLLRKSKVSKKECADT